MIPEFDARTETNIATLHPKVQDKARAFMRLALSRLANSGSGLTVKIICGTRTYAEQDALFAQGRTKPGKKVTNARGGYSNHNFGVAFDVCLFRGKAPVYESPHYRTLGPVGESVGLAWGGRWTSPVDEPHFEHVTGLTLAQMRARKAAGKSVID